MKTTVDFQLTHKEYNTHRNHYFPIMIATSIIGMLCIILSIYMYVQIKQDPSGLFFWPALSLTVGVINMLIYMVLYIKLTARRSKITAPENSSTRYVND